MDYIWIESSSKKKRVALSKEGFYLSAKTVCDYFNVTSEDSWGVCLSKNFVGGLSIYARAEVSGCRISELESRWNAEAGYKLLEKVSIVSLVPTQLFDLVKLGKIAPKNLRLVIVGGGVLRLKENALELGYKIVETYGMTELSSMAGIRDEIDYKILPHLKVKEINGALCFKGESVAKIIESDGVKQEVGEWFESDDLGSVLSNGHFTVKGRKGREVKILGELVNIEQVEEKLSGFFNGRFVVVAKDDDRRGARLCLFSEIPVEIDLINSNLEGLFKISEIRVVDKLPLTESGKVDLNKVEAEFLI